MERRMRMYHHYHHHRHYYHQLPCLHCHPRRYVRLVHHLIERCLLLYMSRDDCVIALEKHACIPPIITMTVWKELQKENRCFFQAYYPHISRRYLVADEPHHKETRLTTCYNLGSNCKHTRPA